VNGRTTEGDVSGLTGIPLIHLRDLIVALARIVCRCQRRVADDTHAKGNWVSESHVRSDAGRKGQENRSLGEHCSVGFCVLFCRVCFVIARPAER
jgi:hypothetical protein